MKQLMITVLILAVATTFSQGDSREESGAGRMQVVGEEGVIGELPLEHTQVEITISGNLQRATVRQIYGNPYDD
ncbi:MAG: hypothetical protein K8S24_09075, partial [Candidatus Aegiribacteria sp.]|nr:hypothetical protein [Candidatus Aegiribacteria sp.]